MTTRSTSGPERKDRCDHGGFFSDQRLELPSTVNSHRKSPMANPKILGSIYGELSIAMLNYQSTIHMCIYISSYYGLIYCIYPIILQFYKFLENYRTCNPDKWPCPIVVFFQPILHDAISAFRSVSIENEFTTQMVKPISNKMMDVCPPNARLELSTKETNHQQYRHQAIKHLNSRTRSYQNCETKQQRMKIYRYT